MTVLATDVEFEYAVDMRCGYELAHYDPVPERVRGGRVTRLEIHGDGRMWLYVDGDQDAPWKTASDTRVPVVRPAAAPSRAAQTALAQLDREVQAIVAAEEQRARTLALPEHTQRSERLTLAGYVVAGDRLLCNWCPWDCKVNVGAMTRHAKREHPEEHAAFLAAQ